MRKTLPFVFFVLLAIGAFAIGFASSWLWQGPERQALASKLAQTQTELESDRVTLSSLRTEKQTLVEDLDAKDESIKVLSTLNEQLKSQAQGADQEIKRLSADLTTARLSLKEREAALTLATKEVETKIAAALVEQQQLAATKLSEKEQELEQMQQNLASLNDAQSAAKAALSAQVQQAEANLGSLTQALKESEAQSQEKDRTLVALQAQLDQAAQNLKDTEAKNATERKAISSELAVAKKELATAQKTASDSEQALAEMVAAFEAAQVTKLEPNSEAGQEAQRQNLATLEENQSALLRAQEEVEAARREASDLADVFEQQAEMLSQLEDEASAYKNQLQSANDEADFLYGEVERYTAQSRSALQALANDVGGLDVLLTPEFKSNFADFLGDIGIQ